MATLKKNRTAQYPLVAEFTFNLTDLMANTSGTTTEFNAAVGTVYDVIALPPNAVLVGGDVTIEVASNTAGATATIEVGDSGSATRYLGATSIKAAARTPLVPTGYRGTGEDLRITLANAAADATAGTITIRAEYIITGRANEVQYN